MDTESNLEEKNLEVLVDKKRIICHSASLLSDPTCSALSASVVPSVRRTCWSDPQEGHKDHQRDGTPLLGRQV